MWWEKVEKQPTADFVVYNKHKRRDVHPDDIKLRILLNKVNADLLGYMNLGVDIELT